MRKNMFLESAKELKKTTALTACAMLVALALILNQVASINLGPYVKIGFSGIPNQIVDYLFGPVSGALFAGVLDIVKYFIKPDGSFFFVYTNSDCFLNNLQWYYALFVSPMYRYIWSFKAGTGDTYGPYVSHVTF